MYDMVSNESGSFLPGTLTTADSSVVSSSPKSSPNDEKDGTNKEKKKRKKVQRTVSFSEGGPVVQQIDSVKSILEDELEQNQDDPELRESLNQIWYDECEVATMKEDNKQLIYEQEDELSLAGGDVGGDAAADEQVLAQLEQKLGDSFRGLERQTEEGSWQHFQNRANVLGAVLDTQSADADEIASLASEATEDARSAAQKRAQQDARDAQEYLSDIRDSLNASMSSLNDNNTFSFHHRPDGDDASVLTANYSDSDEESITSDFTNDIDEEHDQDIVFVGQVGDDEEEQTDETTEEDEPIANNKFTNLKIDGDKPRRASLKEKIQQMNAKPTPPPFQKAKTAEDRRKKAAAEKELQLQRSPSTTGGKRRASARRKIPNRNKSLDLACPIMTMNKPENLIANKEARWLNNVKLPPGVKPPPIQAHASFTALSLTNDDDHDHDDVDDDGESLLSQGKRSSAPAKVMITMEKTTTTKKQTETTPTSNNGTQTKPSPGKTEAKPSSTKAEAKATAKQIKAKAPSSKAAKRLSGSSLSLTDEDDISGDEEDVVAFLDTNINKSDTSIGLLELQETSKKAKRTSAIKAKVSKTKDDIPGPPQFKKSASLGSKTATNNNSDEALKPPTLKASTSLGASATSLSLGASGTSLSLADEEGETTTDYDMDAKAAIKAIKKTRKKIKRNKTMPARGRQSSSSLDLSCPMMSMNKPSSPTTTKTKTAKSKSPKDQDDGKTTASAKPKRRVTRVKTAPSRTLQDMSMNDGSSRDMNDSSRNMDDGIRDTNNNDSNKPSKRRSSSVVNENSSNLPSMFSAASKKKVPSKRASCTSIPAAYQWKDHSSALGSEDGSESTGQELEAGAEKPPSLKTRASTGALTPKKSKSKEKRASCSALPSFELKDHGLDSDDDDSEAGKTKNSTGNLGMTGTLGMLIAEAPKSSAKNAKKKEDDDDEEEEEESEDPKSRRHSISGAFGALLSMDASPLDDDAEEDQPKQRASTGDILPKKKKKVLRTSSSRVGASATPRKSLPSRSNSAPKKALLPSNSSRGAPSVRGAPRATSSMGSKKAKLPSNGKRSSTAVVGRIPRRKAGASEGNDASKEALARSNSSVN